VKAVVTRRERDEECEFACPRVEIRFGRVSVPVEGSAALEERDQLIRGIGLVAQWKARCSRLIVNTVCCYRNSSGQVCDATLLVKESTDTDFSIMGYGILNQARELCYASSSFPVCQ
jgi:hypothetical protein